MYHIWATANARPEHHFVRVYVVIFRFAICDQKTYTHTHTKKTPLQIVLCYTSVCVRVLFAKHNIYNKPNII